MEEGAEVQLYIYDLSQGMAATFSQMFIQKHIDGIWHTAIVVYGKEIYFGGSGISATTPGTTVLGQPLRKETLGVTQVPYEILLDYLNGLASSTFAGHTYNLLRHNCNTFSNELSQFLVGKQIPQYILDLPNEALSSPIVQQFLPILEFNPIISGGGGGNLLRPPSPEFEQLNQDIEEARQKSAALEQRRIAINEKIEKRERRKKKKKRKQSISSRQSSVDFGSESSTARATSRDVDRPWFDEYTPDCSSSSSSCGGSRKQNSNSPRRPYTMSDEPQTNGTQERTTDQVVDEIETEERREREERRKNREPPIVFKDSINVKEEFDALVNLIDSKLSDDDLKSLEELHQYMLEDEGSWALGENFLQFIGFLLNETSFPSEVRVRTLNILTSAAVKDDVILLLHQDRREHILMNYAHDVDRLPIDEQIALTAFMVNLFESLSSSEWLLYISEWTYSSSQISNIRVSTKVAVNALLSENPRLQDLGSAFVHNLASKEVKSVVFDDVAVEIAMAVLQFFNMKPDEEKLFRCMKALGRFVHVSRNDVPQLIQMIGPPPSKFKGVSDRLDEQILIVEQKL
uniref:Desumoylating isopeptidase 1 n=1 Tax=Cacopsylla melanoneura TaxID=428564 RepID=A0A8D8TQ74_9HEMI